ncbi:hypothetical protein ACFLV7_01610 [Chloroflexota bacterium]
MSTEYLQSIVNPKVLFLICYFLFPFTLPCTYYPMLSRSSAPPAQDQAPLVCMVRVCRAAGLRHRMGLSPEVEGEGTGFKGLPVLL